MSLVPSSNTKHDRPMMTIKEFQRIFVGSIRDCFKFDDQMFLTGLEGTSLEKDGDFICLNIFRICEGVKKLDPRLDPKPQAIAKQLVEAVEKYPGSAMMIDHLRVHDVGYITFKLSSKWMEERIKKMLIEGIETWAPTSVQRAVFLEPHPAIGVELHADSVRSGYILKMLSNMFAYTGAAVGVQSDEAIEAALAYFYEDQGQIKSKRHNEPLFVLKEGGSRTRPGSNVFDDLGTLWTAIDKQRAEFIVYVTPVRQQEYIKKCIAAAEAEGWLRNSRVRCCAYQTSSMDREKVAYLRENLLGHSKAPSLVRLGEMAGYSAEASFECALKFTYLKTHTMTECIFNIDEMVDEEGDSFLYLLKTYTKNFPSHRRGLEVYTDAFIEKEHKLSLHLVSFTEVIDMACRTFRVHLVCEYMLKLCKIYTSYVDEVLQHLDSETYMSKKILYDAFRVVMEKCFHLLGITPELCHCEFYIRQRPLTFDDYFVPLPESDARSKHPEHLNPRLEMFGMNVVVYDRNFTSGDLFGTLSLIDEEGLLSDQRFPPQRNDHGHVCYFFHDWDNTIGILRNSELLFGNPTPPCSVPCWGDIRIDALLYVVSSDKQRCSRIVNGRKTLTLPKFQNDERVKRGTCRFGDKDGSIDIDYVYLKDAVDASMQLRFEARTGHKKVHVTGNICAYYDNVVDGLHELSQRRFKAVLFHADVGFVMTDGPIKLKRSVMAAPADGCLVIEVCILDVEAECYVKEIVRLTPGTTEWRMQWGKGSFIWTVDWTKGPRIMFR